MVQNVFLNENVGFENFFPVEIFSQGHSRSLKNWWPQNRNFFAKSFLARIDLEWSKTHYKTKISTLKIFTIKIFSRACQTLEIGMMRE